MENWFIRNKNIDYKEIANKFNISTVLSKILVNRDIYSPYEIERFLYGSLRDLHSPFILLGVSEAATIIKNKIDTDKRIRIIGDYDVDGIMSVYILYKSLLDLGARVDYVIPNRIMDGYGINTQIVEEAKNDGIDTIITCDNGIAALEAIRLAKDLGLTTIITDHHDLIFTEESNCKKYIYPEANVIINPKNPKCKYPFKYLCGAGVVFKLIEGIYNLYNISDHSIYEFLEYVAIATICDVVDLVDENRIIVKYGLQILNSTKNIGLEALIKESGIDKDISSYHIGFIIGPTLNASGRLNTAYIALELLLSEDRTLAAEKAKELRNLNEDRKDITESGLNKVLDQIESSHIKNDKVLIIYEPTIHESVAGIIAGRVKDRYNKPTIVLTNGQEGIKGSGRSIEEYNMFEELSKYKELLNRFGGHPMAAGLSLDASKVDLLRKSLNEATSLTQEDLIRKIYVDMALPIEYISYKQIKELDVLEPFGKSNPKPLFGDRKLSISKAFKLGKNKNVLKLILCSASGGTIEALLFKDIESFEEAIIEKYGQDGLCDIYRGNNSQIEIDILYYPSINEYMGKLTLQVIIQNYRI